MVHFSQKLPPSHSTHPTHTLPAPYPQPTCTLPTTYPPIARNRHALSLASPLPPRKRWAHPPHDLFQKMMEGRSFHALYWRDLAPRPALPPWSCSWLTTTLPSPPSRQTKDRR